MRITKQEYIKLYCDEDLYRSTGVVAIDADKFAKQLISNPFQTAEDMEEFGVLETLRQNDIESVSTINKRNGSIETLPSQIGSMDDLFDWGSENSIK